MLLLNSSPFPFNFSTVVFNVDFQLVHHVQEEVCGGDDSALTFGDESGDVVFKRELKRVILN